MIRFLDPDLLAPFPNVETAEREPDGLLAVGGDLRAERLLLGYRHGIFPWYSHGQPILWWSPDPRTVLFPAQMRVTRSLRKAARNRGFEVSIDHAFDKVIRHCAGPRKDRMGTWITQDMILAYENLHQLGHAHSVEVWHAGRLCGGLYGVSMGRVFFGESMFSTVRDASKIALAHLAALSLAQGYRMIDCQVYSEHLGSLGATPIHRQEFSACLDRWCPEAPEAPITAIPAAPAIVPTSVPALADEREDTAP